jgi:hypothetical protein
MLPSKYVVSKRAGEKLEKPLSGRLLVRINLAIQKMIPTAARRSLEIAEQGTGETPTKNMVTQVVCDRRTGKSFVSVNVNAYKIRQNRPRRSRHLVKQTILPIEHNNRYYRDCKFFRIIWQI